MKKRKSKKVFYRKWKNHVLDSKSKCGDCNGKILYFYKYDAYFCPQCNEWISIKCDDPNCSYCVDRPETPEEALALCKMTLGYEYAYRNSGKKRTIRHYIANEKHKKREAGITFRY